MTVRASVIRREATSPNINRGTFGIFEQIEERILSRKKASDETYITIFFHTLVDALSSVLHPGGHHHKLEAKREPVYCN